MRGRHERFVLRAWRAGNWEDTKKREGETNREGGVCFSINQKGEGARGTFSGAGWAPTHMSAQHAPDPVCAHVQARPRNYAFPREAILESARGNPLKIWPSGLQAREVAESPWNQDPVPRGSRLGGRRQVQTCLPVSGASLDSNSMLWTTWGTVAWGHRPSRLGPRDLSINCPLSYPYSLPAPSPLPGAEEVAGLGVSSSHSSVG